MDVACPGNPPFGRSRPPLVAGAGGGEVVGAQRVSCARVSCKVHGSGVSEKGRTLRSGFSRARAASPVIPSERSESRHPHFSRLPGPCQSDSVAGSPRPLRTIWHTRPLHATPAIGRHSDKCLPVKGLRTDTTGPPVALGAACRRPTRRHYAPPQPRRRTCTVPVNATSPRNPCAAHGSTTPPC
jgi:hypothetical protein